jgi:hypothetical protein
MRNQNHRNHEDRTMQGICFHVWIWRARAETAHSVNRVKVCHNFYKMSLNLCVNLLNFCGIIERFFGS